MSLLLGFGYALVTAVLWALNPALISRYRASVHPLLLTGLRALLALVPAVLLCSVLGFSAEVTPLSVLLFFTASFIGPGVGDAAYTRAIQLVGGGRAVVVAYTYIFVAQGLSALAGEVVGPGVVAGAVLAFLGLLVSRPRNSGGAGPSLKGLGYAALSSVCWGFGTVLTTMSLHYTDPASLLVIRISVLAFTFIPAGLAAVSVRRGYSLSRNFRDLMICSGLTGVVGWFGGMYFFLLSLATAGTAMTVLATALTPILSMVTTRSIAGESHGLRLVLGAGLTSLGIGVATLLT